MISKKSRFLVRALRHDPSILNLTLDKRGWANVADVLKSLSINKAILDEIVSTNNKQRFEYNDNQTKIRASQGHSLKNIEVFKDWNDYIPIDVLYHGTAQQFINQILNSKLISKTRTHVHLSKDITTALNVGSRHGKPILLEIDAVRMYKDGYKFYESSNGVILINEVPGKYLRRLDNGHLAYSKYK
jgi:putative RNA 2'-phosphotransferase